MLAVGDVVTAMVGKGMNNSYWARQYSADDWREEGMLHAARFNH